MDIDPAQLGDALTREYEKAQRIFRQGLARQFVVGRQLAEIRDALGETAFRCWLTEFCPAIPLADAEALIQYRLQSGLAQKVGDVLTATRTS